MSTIVTGTVVKSSSTYPCPTEWVWVALDYPETCKVPLLPSSFKRLKIPIEKGIRVKLDVGDIHAYLLGRA